MVAEITVTAELLNRDPVEIIATIMHEIVHVWQHFLGLKGVSTGGRHNKVFKEYANIVGLEVLTPAIDSYGLGYTTPGEELRERIEDEFQPDVAAFNLFRLIKTKEKKTVTTNAWVCGCEGITARIPMKKVMNSICQECQMYWTKKLTPAEQEVVDALAEATREMEASGHDEITVDGEVSAGVHDVHEAEAEDVEANQHEGDAEGPPADVGPVSKAPRTGRKRKTKS